MIFPACGLQAGDVATDGSGKAYRPASRLTRFWNDGMLAAFNPRLHGGKRMRKCETRRLAAALALTGGMMGAMTGAALGLTAQQQQAACQDDAMRLCSAAIPDEGRIHSCLYQYRASISPACRAIVAPAKKRRRH